ncbi:MAG: TetR/AcrR family transcriptional regulator [Proteobacteria bacterium]|nr:MAG: TetR/AcrR family transcriptional regulator [Pseudomonadota bacterium]
MRIIEAAIKSFAKNGLEKTTYTLLARECKISRPLIHHYFPEMTDLFALAARYVRQTLLQCAVSAMKKASGEPDAQLRAYIRGCFNWIRDYQEQNSFWLLYFYQASLKGAAREENTALVKAGHERIQNLINEGNEAGLWNSKSPVEDSKTIQVALTGALVSCMTEDGFLTTNRSESLMMNLVFRDILTASRTR